MASSNFAVASSLLLPQLEISPAPTRTTLLDELVDVGVGLIGGTSVGVDVAGTADGMGVAVDVDGSAEGADVAVDVDGLIVGRGVAVELPVPGITINCGGVAPSRDENVTPSVLSATRANV